MYHRILLLFVFLLTAAFQGIEPLPETTDPNANISWPPPIYVLRGDVTVRGSANLPGMTSYFLEFRALNEDFTPQDDTVSWSPATLPVAAAVLDDELGTWNTLMAPDGAYELRLTINVGGSTPVHTRVSPLRIENEPPPFAVTPTTVALPTLVPTPTAFQQDLPTLIPTPTAFDTSPEAVVIVSSGNIREGDNTSYPVVGTVVINQTLQLIGRSSTGSGWWYVQLPNGRRGFAAPSLLRVSGDTRNLPRIDPPATPAPVASPTPPLPDAAMIGARFDRDITEGENFQVIMTIRNNSPVPLPQVSVACNFTPVNEFFSTFLDSLAGNTQVDVAIVVRLDEGGGEQVTANCAVDVNNLVAEIDEGNNFFNISQNLDEP